MEMVEETEEKRRWCLFTSAGDNNAIRLWLSGATARHWALVVGYYGDSDREFSSITSMSSYAFRSKGGKFQLLKNLLKQHPQFFEHYMYVWVCDDDIQMQAAQIDEAFAITELCGFWVAQPAFLPEGQNSHSITVYANSRYDYRTVNFIEEGVPIFRRDKLIEFMAIYDGSLLSFGTDHWYMNFFKAHQLSRVRHFFRSNELGRFAIIDRVQVLNPHSAQKGGREIDRLGTASQRSAAWLQTMAKYDLAKFPHVVFVSCSLRRGRPRGIVVSRFDIVRQVAIDVMRRLRRSKVRAWNNVMDLRLGFWRVLSRVQRSSSTSSLTAIGPRHRNLAERLGYDLATRLLIVHADDFGMAQAVNAAIIKGFETGLINSASAMVPCAWFPEVVAFARSRPEADLGLHLTLTSERAGYRWGPSAPMSKVPSLVDQYGYFHQKWTANTRINAWEVEIELRAQIERAYAAGLRPTHLDSHQTKLQLSGRRLFEVCVNLGREYGLPVFVSRDWVTRFPYLNSLTTAGDVVIDRIVAIVSEIPPQSWGVYYRQAIESLIPGVTQFVIHPGLNSPELQTLCNDHPAWGAAWRQRDFDFFTSNEFRNLLAKHDIKLITWREIKARLGERH